MSQTRESSAPAARIPLVDSDPMTADQRAVFEEIVSGPRGRLVGPLRAALHNPALADRWQKLGKVLRYETSLPRTLSELAIIVVARHWNSPLEWAIHSVEARNAGLDTSIIETIHRREAPVFELEPESEVYDFSRQLLATGQVGAGTYDAVRQRWGVVGVVELTALIGYYTMVAMTLNAHAIPLPTGVISDLEQARFEPLPPALTPDDPRSK